MDEAAAHPHATAGAALSAALDSLAQDASQLAAEIADSAAEAARAAGGDASSAARLALAEHVLPVSAKSELSTARERYLEGLRRRRVRLQREGQVLAEQASRLAAEADRLRDARRRLDERRAVLSQRGDSVRSLLEETRLQRERTVAWAAAVGEHSRQMSVWGTRVSRHAGRVAPPPLPP